jgi:uncharacterized RDD family membrane protein YckC
MTESPLPTPMLRYAGFWRRSGAHLIDFLLTNGGSWLVEQVIFGAMYGVYYLIARAQHSVLKPYDSAFDPILEQGVSVIVYSAIVLPYYIWMTYRTGATPGKKLLGIRVVSALDGGAIGLKQSVIRCLGYVASYAALGCGFLMVAFHPRKQALHDLFAGTVTVVRDKL